MRHCNQKSDFISLLVCEACGSKSHSLGMWPECLHYIYKRKVLLVSALFRGPAFPNYLHVKQRGENTNQIQEVLLILTPSEKKCRHFALAFLLNGFVDHFAFYGT